MFNLIKRLFSRRKEDQKGSDQQAESTVAQENRTLIDTFEGKKPEKNAPKPEEPRKEKICANCRAPNDVFVDKCWLCKKNV